MHRQSPLRRRNLNALRILDDIGVPAAKAAGAAVFLLTGLPGAGKSTFARGLEAITGAVILESDRFRALLFGTPVHSSRESGILFRAIRAAALRLLEDGHAVIIDATNLSESDRRPFYQLAETAGVRLFVIALEAPVAVVEARLADRLAASIGCSYADVDVYHRMRGRVEPISRPYSRVDTSNPAAVEAALTAIAAAFEEAVGKGTGVN